MRNLIEATRLQSRRRWPDVQEALGVGVGREARESPAAKHPNDFDFSPGRTVYGPFQLLGDLSV